MILLDTHVLVWLVSGERSLGSRARRMIDAAQREGEATVSAITFWEYALLFQRGRLDGQRDPTQWRRDVLAAGLLELGLTGDIGIRATELDNLPSDPADRFIVTTALVREATLVTADTQLLAWRGKLKRHDARR